MNVIEARGKKIYKSGKGPESGTRKKTVKNSRSLRVRGSSRVF